MPNTTVLRWLSVLLVSLALPAYGFSVPIDRGPNLIYLRVGDGGFSGLYLQNGTAGNLTTINQVSVAVPAANVGNGVAQAMTSNATQAQSYYDGAVFCNLPSQVYVGGFYRRAGNSGAAQASLQVNAPASLVNAVGDLIPISQIQWTSGGNRGAAGTIPAGSFSGGTQVLAAIPKNYWAESCHAFSYRNQAVVPSGVYQARVTYTLTVL